MYIQSPNYWQGRNGHAPKWIIVHSTAGGSSAESVARNVFCDPNVRASAHWIIGLDGEIVQTVAEHDTAWANGVITGIPGNASPNSNNDIRDHWWTEAINPNFQTISIEHVKSDDNNSNQLTEPQKKSSFKLINEICDRWKIPKRMADEHGGITGHFSIDAINRSACPGDYPWKELIKSFRGSMIPNKWEDNGKELLAPNGKKVKEGFRKFILDHEWDENDLPLTNEIEYENLELSNPAIGKGSKQIFNLSVLEYTPSRGVFKAYVGPELITLREMRCSDNLKNHLKTMRDMIDTVLESNN